MRYRHSRYALTLIVLVAVHGQVCHADQPFEEVSKCSVSCMQIAYGTSKPYQLPKNIQLGANLSDDYQDLLRDWASYEKRESATEFADRAVTSVLGGEVGAAPIIGPFLSTGLSMAESRVEDERREAERRALGGWLKSIANEKELPELIRDVKSHGSTNTLSTVDSYLRRANILQGASSAFDGLSSTARNQVQAELVRLLLGGATKLAGVEAATRSNSARLKKQMNALEAVLAKMQTEHAKCASTLASVTESPNPSRWTPEKVKEFATETRQYSEQFQDFSEILGQLHAPANVVRTVSLTGQTIQLAGQVAACGVDSFSCMPAVLSGMHLLAGLGGGTQADPMQQMYAELLHRLDEIELKIDKYHQEEMKALDALAGNQVIIYDFLRDVSIKPIVNCRDLVNSSAYVDLFGDSPDGAYLRPHVSTRFSSYESFRQVADSYASEIQPCETAMQTLFPLTLSEDIDPRFLISRLVNTPTMPPGLSQAEYEYLRSHEIFGAYSKFLNEYLAPDVLDMAVEPASTILQLDGRVAGATAEASPPSASIEFVRRNFHEQLDAAMVRRTSGILVGMHFYWQMANGDGAIPLQTLFRGGVRGGGTAERLLTSALSLLDLTIAQQTLLGGGALLPVAYRAWQVYTDGDRFLDPDRDLICGQWSGHNLLRATQNDCGSSEKVRDMAEGIRSALFEERTGILSRNPLLARNMVRYIVAHRLRDHGHSVLAYEVAWSVRQDSALLRQCLGDDLGLFYADGSADAEGQGWYMTMFGTRVLLPTPNEVASGSLLFQSTTVGLIDVRKRIEDALIGYRVASDPKISESQWKVAVPLIRAKAWPLDSQYKQ